MNLSTWAFIAGLAGFFLPVPFVPSVLAIRLGKKSEQEDGPSGLARAGIILGWVGIVLWGISCCSLSVFGALQFSELYHRDSALLLTEPAAPGPVGDSTLLPTESMAVSGVYLGIRCEDKGGAKVVEVISGSPAERAGLQPGDAILALDSHGVVDCTDLANEIRARSPGQSVVLKVLRGDEIVQVSVILGVR